MLERGGLGQEEDLGQLVLSPQRRSFLSGCAAAAGEAGGEVSLRPEVRAGEVACLPQGISDQPCPACDLPLTVSDLCHNSTTAHNFSSSFP